MCFYAVSRISLEMELGNTVSWKAGRREATSAPADNTSCPHPLGAKGDPAVCTCGDVNELTRDAVYNREGIVHGGGKGKDGTVTYFCTGVLLHRQVLIKRKILPLQRHGVTFKGISKAVFSTAKTFQGLKLAVGLSVQLSSTFLLH